jgi:transglutaminase-like putative cysteine protease
MSLYQPKIPAYSAGFRNFFFSGSRAIRQQDAADWVRLAAMLLPLGIAVWSVDQAGWVRPTTSLTGVLVLAALASFLLIKSGLKLYFLHPLALLIGLAVIFIQGLLVLPDPGLDLRVLHLSSDLQAWWHAQVYGAPSPVTLHIVLIFGFLAWLAGYLSTWSLIKKGNQWVAVLLGLLIVLVNLNFCRSDKYYFFPLYLAAALLFLFLAAYLKNRSQIIAGNTHGSGLKPVYLLVASLFVIFITVSLAWINPGFRISPIADFTRAHDPFRGSVELYWQSFFAPVPGTKVPTLNHGGQRDLVFGGPLELSDQVVFIINTDRSYYWKTQVYDVYTSTGWTTGEAKAETVPGVNQGNVSAAGEYIYTLIPQVTTDVLPSVGEFAAASVPVVERVLTHQVFSISLQNSSSDSQLPPDIAAAGVNIRKVRSNRRRTQEQISALLPPGLKLESLEYSGTLPESILVSRLSPEDKNIVALSSAQVLLQQKRASIAVVPPPVVNDSALKAAGSTYPARITDRYLQLPSTLPARTKTLAAEITLSSTTPYEKASDIKKYLAALRYDISIDAPPEGEDGVDYFLFTQKSGYCNYFASAATVLLRSAGVPARMVVGFMHGQYDKGANSYIIRDRDYHAWTEVYYPGQGWIALDATPPAEEPTPGSSSGAMPYLDYPFIPNYPDTGQAAVSGTVTKNAQNNSSLNLLLFLIGYGVIVLFLLFFFHSAERPRNKTALYSRMVLLASLAGLGPGTRQTELEFSRRLARALPGKADVINGITRSYLLYHYAREAPALPMEVEFKKTWPGLRIALVKRIFRPLFHFHMNL